MLAFTPRLPSAFCVPAVALPESPLTLISWVLLMGMAASTTLTRPPSCPPDACPLALPSSSFVPSLLLRETNTAELDWDLRTSEATPADWGGGGATDMFGAAGFFSSL